MTIHVGETLKIESNPIDGFDVYYCPTDKVTGQPKVDGKGNKRWAFLGYHPTLLACRKNLLEHMVAPLELDTFDKINAALDEALRILTAHDAGITPQQWGMSRADE
jgi:hypothetical protein